MNSKQNSKLAMYVITAGVEPATDSAIIAKMPMFPVRMAQLNEGISEIDIAAALQRDHARTGRLEKSGSRNNLINEMLETSTALIACATRLGKPDVAESFHFSVSAYKKLKDKELELEATNLIKVINDMETELVDYGIAKTEIAALTAAAASYSNLIHLPRLNIVAKKDATKSLKTGFTKCDDAIHHLDLLVNMMRTREPAFYTDYWNRRTLVSAPTFANAVIGYVVDRAGKPVKGARIAVENSEVSAKTGKKGRFTIKKLPEGVYVLRVTHPGHEELLHTASVTEGYQTRVPIALREM